MNKKSSSIPETIIDLIRKSLENGNLKAGDQLPSETELSEKLSVSRSSVREAMKILSVYGVVNIERGRGTFIAKDTDSEDFVNPLLFNFLLLKPEKKEIEEYRYFIERSVFEMAVKNATQDDIKMLEENLNCLKSSSGPSSQTAQLDLEFHKILGKATKNRLLEKTYLIAMRYFLPAISKTHYNQKHLEETIYIHEASINIIKKRDINSISKVLEMNNEIWFRLSEN